jgi:hypothetical protein
MTKHYAYHSDQKARSEKVQSSRTASFAAAIAVVLAAGLGACSNDTGKNFFTTGSLGEPTEAAAAPVAAKVASPECVALAAQIDKLRQDGSVDRLEKAAVDGKSSNVSVKRATLQTQSQLNKANADYITKCGPALPKPSVTAALPANVQVKPAAQTAPGMQKAATNTAANTASNTGITIVPPAAAPQQ